MPVFPQLHVHTAFSMRRGASQPDALVSTASKLGCTHLAATDIDGLWAIPGFVRACVREGVNHLIGALLTAHENPLRRVLVLTENLDAFRRLSEIVSLRNLDPENFDPLEKAVEYAHEGFVLLADRPGNFVELDKKVPPGRLFGEISWGERSFTRKRFFEMIKTSRAIGRPLAATGNVHMASRDDYLVHALLTAMRTGKCMRDRLPTADLACRLMPPEEFEKPFHAHNVSEALSNAREIAVRCAWKWPDRQWLIPPPPDLPQGKRPIDHLKETVIPRLKEKYGRWDSVINARLEKELGVIDEQGFASFFLIVADVVRESHRRGYRTLGRGSAGDSIVSYGLDISQVDPIRYDLYFERFLNPERSSPPDIDLDFSWQHRDEMVEYVEKRYGPEKTASVGTIVTFGLRGAFREVGKAMGYSNVEISRWSLYLPTWWDDSGEHLDEHPVAGDLPLKDEPIKTILARAMRLQEMPVHQSVHVGGLVLSPEPISRYAPLNRAAKGFVITQYDMRDCEKVGLIKLDLLSQRGLGVLEDGLQAIARHGKTIDIDIENPDELSADPDTAKLFKSGRTVGCFDAESPMIRGLIRRLGGHSYDLHMVATSLIRPGVSASGMMDEFIRRHNDPSSIKHIHPKMGEILKDTHGIIVYQEDVLKVLHEVAGVTLGEADILRRMMSGKSTDSRFAKDELENKFMENCETRGIDKEAREKIWNQVASFVGYSFCKAHAAQFAILAYQTAWLKAHHTAEFFAARLANMGGFFPPDLYIRDARRFGLHIELPEVNRSERTCEGKDNRIILGLDQVGCLQELSIDSILLARNTGGPFASVADFLARTGVGYEQTHALIRVGAFRSLHAPRPVLLGELDEAVRAKMRRPSSLAPAAPRQPLLFAGRIGAEEKSEAFFDRDEIVRRNDYSLFEQIQAEVDVIGFIVSIHPLEPLAEAMRKAGFVQSSDMNRFDGKRVRMGGILTAFKPVTTKNNDPMAIISLEDLSGTFDTVIFPEAYKRHALMLRSQADGGLCVEGKIQVSFGLANLIVEKVITLGEALGIKARRRRPIGDVKMGPRVSVPTYPPDIEHKESIETTESKEHAEVRGENRVSEPCAASGPV